MCVHVHVSKMEIYSTEGNKVCVCVCVCVCVYTFTYLKQYPMKETREAALILPDWTRKPPSVDTVKMEK